MKRYYIDLRSCEQSEHDRIMALLDLLAWDVYPISNIPKTYEFMWDREESALKIPEIPENLISVHPLQNM